MISFLYSSKYACSGETVVCLVKGTEKTAAHDNAIIFAQVHGHISADFRWLSTSKKIHEIFMDHQGPSLEHTQLTVPPPLILGQHHTSSCIFSTSRVALSPSHVFEEGTFLEFEIPDGALPTFRGLCASMSYFITLTVQYQTETETMNYPLIVQGAGSAALPYSIRHSSLVAYPAASLPVELLLSAPAPGYKVAQSDAADDSASAAREVPNLYKIRDKEHICDLSLPSKCGIVGKDLEIFLDFQRNAQECSMVRATLVMTETRPEGSRIQEKVVAKTTRTATDALHLNLSLNIPLDAPCSFSTPLFQLCYRLHVDFCLGDEPTSGGGGGDAFTRKGSQGASASVGRGQGAGTFADAFTFSVPIQVLQAAQHRPVAGAGDELSSLPGGGGESAQSGMRGERIAPSRSSVVSVQQQALRCMDSDFVVTPIRVL